VVSDTFSFSYPIDIFHGITDTAQAHGVNIMYAAGGPLRAVDGTPMARGFILNLIGPDNADGIIIVSSLLATASRLEEFITYCKQYEPLPAVSVGLKLPGIPSITIANYTGVYNEVTHLIDVHGYRRIAFIRGPEGHPEAEERLRGYTDALTAHGILIDPALIVSGQFSVQSGAQAVTTLLDQHGVAFEAIVAASDQIALGALETLEARGIHVPGQVALTGFDDIDVARNTNPALTTVRQPYYAVGAHALETLLARMAGKDVPEAFQVPTECIIRESCGCLRREVLYVMEEPIPASAPLSSCQALFTARMPDILHELAHSSGSPLGDQLLAWLDTLLGKFCQDLETAGNAVFVPALYEILRQIIKTGDDVERWPHIVSVLRQHTMSAHFQPAQQRHAELLWQQAWLVVAQMTRQAQDARLIRTRQLVRKMSDLGAELQTTFHVAGILDVLAGQLPRLGIPRCYLALYEEMDTYRYPEPPPEWARLVLAYTEQGRLEIPPTGQRFPSRWLLPPNSHPTEEPAVMVVTSLDSQNQLLGFIIYEDRLEEKLFYRDLRLQISSALHGALLVQRLQERSAELTRQQYVLNMFMENIPDRIYFKDLQSRFTRANHALAHHLGLSDPAQQIGKSDWDFFPEEQAKVKYEQERQIISTGQPILGLEEPDGMGRWALTTKMPLRDEHGAIIGTFGISHDITELKQAQAELQKAYADIERRVEARTAELQHEIAERNRTEEALRESEARYRALVESQIDLISRYLPDTTLTFVNDAYCQFFGKTREELIGNSYLFMIAPEYRELVRQETADLAKHPRPLAGEYLNYRWDGEEHWIQWIVRCITDNKGQVVELQAVGRDITRLKQQEAEREALIAELETKNAELERFTYTVSHDLKSPLITIGGFVGFLEKDALAGDEKQIKVDIAHINDAVGKMQRLLDELLELSRIGRKMNPPEVIPFTDIAHEAVALVHGRIVARGIIVQITPDLPIVYGDRARLVEVVQNLVDNACKFISEQPHPRIEIGVRQSEAEPVFYVRDNGIGIEPQYHSKVFGLFEKLNPQSEGTGVGLALVKRIIETHGGQIWVESEGAGKGTTFCFTLNSETTT
jgi:PAS domain S-box-containing protein